MHCIEKPFVHLAINAVDTVVHDPDGQLDAEQYDHYDSFVAARDAALSSIEVMLDEADYDGDDHRDELERMLGLLEASTSYEDLAHHAYHRWLIGRLDPAQTAAA